MSGYHLQLNGSNQLRYQGRLTHWNDDRGFGFVEPNGGGERAFVHIKAFTKPSRRPVNGDLIIYKPIKDSKGKLTATGISLVADTKQKSHSTERTNSQKGIWFALLFCVTLGALIISEWIPLTIGWLYVITSLVAFTLYAMDKSAAKNNRWRTPESHLHFIALVGGWPGALFAQRMLRHKSSKREFQRLFWVTSLINIAAFGWLLSPAGTVLRQAL